MNFAEKVPAEEKKSILLRRFISSAVMKLCVNVSSLAPAFTSLNKHLPNGKKLNRFCYIFWLNFWVGEIAVTIDIANAFLQMDVGTRIE